MSIEQSTQSKVLTILERGVPVTRRIIQERTGLAANTVIKALDEMGLEPKRVGNVLTYSLSNEAAPVDHLHNSARFNSNRTILIDMEKSYHGPVSDYDAVVHKIPAALPVKLTPDLDPRDIVQTLTDYASFLATIAYEIKQHQNNAEWFQLIGGRDE